MKPEIIYLDISTWRGISIGAIHWYGSLKSSIYGKKEVELTHPLTEKETEYLLSKRDGYGCWEVGGEYSGFWSEAEIPIVAKRVWRTHFPDGFALIQGDRCLAEPQKVIDGGELFDFAKVTNATYDSWQKLGMDPWGKKTRQYAEKINTIWRKWEKKWEKQYEKHIAKKNKKSSKA